MDTGHVIAELRREAGYTQRDLADLLNVTDKAVSKWERGICMPDVSLLPKLALLLDVDIDLLVTQPHQIQKHVGFIDLSQSRLSLSQVIYDKPLAFYLLMHFALLGITNIYIRTGESNVDCLSDPLYAALGFSFIVNPCYIPESDLMIMNKPFFLFGSDLTRQFQGAMLSKHPIKLIPTNQAETFLFIPAKYSSLYMQEPEEFSKTLSYRNLGRGMIYIPMDNKENFQDIASVVECYQRNSGLLLGSLEEILYNRKIINKQQLLSLTFEKPYMNLLKP